MENATIRINSHNTQTGSSNEEKKTNNQTNCFEEINYNWCSAEFWRDLNTRVKIMALSRFYNEKMICVLFASAKINFQTNEKCGTS